MYTVTILRTARKSIDRFNAQDSERIYTVLAALADDPRPHGCIKLKGREAWRIRVGDYRIIYEIDDGVLIVTVVEVGHRKDIYR